MSTAVQRAIESLSDPQVPIADGLLSVLIVASRIQAEELEKWVRLELDGYENASEVPAYRDVSTAPVVIQFDGIGNWREVLRLSRDDLPSSLQVPLDNLYLRQGVGELVALSSGSKDPQFSLPTRWTALYRSLAAEDKVPNLRMMVANEAYVSLPQTRLAGILHRIKSAALTLCLNVERVSTLAGETNGPTVGSDAELGGVVQQHMTVVVGNHSNVSLGSGASVTNVSIAAGDVDGLLAASRSIIDAEATRDLASAIEADGGNGGEATKTFMRRLQAGGYGLAAGLTVNGAYDGLKILLQQVFPDLELG